MTVDLEGLTTIREAARECHRSTETVRRWVWAGKLHAEKVGNQLFARRSDLGRLCKETAEQTRSELELFGSRGSNRGWRWWRRPCSFPS